MAELALSVREVAKLLGLSEHTIYHMVYARQIPHKRIRTARGKGKSGKIIFSRVLLEKWLEESEPTKQRKVGCK